MLCCARAVTRHAAAPPRSVMTLRRFNCSNCIRPPAILGQFAGYRTGGDKPAGIPAFANRSADGVPAAGPLWVTSGPMDDSKLRERMPSNSIDHLVGLHQH